MPAPNRRDAVTNALPMARKAIHHLRTSGQADRATVMALANAIAVVCDYAEDAVERVSRARIRYDRADQTRSVETNRALRDHFHQAAAAAGTDVTSVVVRRFQAYLDGSWMPEPLPRAPRGTVADPAKINLRVGDLWDQVADKARDPERNQGRRMTAPRVALAALVAEFPAPDTDAE